MVLMCSGRVWRMGMDNTMENVKIGVEKLIIGKIL